MPVAPGNAAGIAYSANKRGVAQLHHAPHPDITDDGPLKDAARDMRCGFARFHFVGAKCPRAPLSAVSLIFRRFRASVNLNCSLRAREASAQWLTCWVVRRQKVTSLIFKAFELAFATFAHYTRARDVDGFATLLTSTALTQRQCRSPITTGRRARPAPRCTGEDSEFSLSGRLSLYLPTARI